MGLDNNNPIVLTVVTSGASFARSFSVKVTQIECDSLSKGNPDDTMIRGVIDTFVVLDICNYYIEHNPIICQMTHTKLSQ